MYSSRLLTRRSFKKLNKTGDSRRGEEAVGLQRDDGQVKLGLELADRRFQARYVAEIAAAASVADAAWTRDLRWLIDHPSATPQEAQEQRVYIYRSGVRAMPRP